MTLFQKGFGSFLARERMKRGQTQAQLASALNVSVQTISAWEKGVSIAPHRFPELASELEVPVEILYHFHEVMDSVQRKINAHQDILPLIRSIVEAKCPSLTFEDLIYLMEVQEGLPVSTPLLVIQELLRCRQAESTRLVI